MLLIKRAIAGIINFILFVIFTIVISKIFHYVKFDPDAKYFYLFVFASTYFIPILFLKNSIGYKILNIPCNSHLRLQIKYIIYYIFISNVLLRITSLFGELSNYSFNNLFSPISYLIFIVALGLINILLFFFSFGRYNLFDFILKIFYSKKIYNRSSNLYLIIWFSLFYVTSFLGILSNQYHIADYMNKFMKMNLGYNFTNYYPKDVFDEFVYFQTEKINFNNNVITFSDTKSLYQNNFLGQKTIYALINKQTFENEIKRYTLCKYLINYSIINDFFDGISDEISQTKLMLIYNEPQTYFSMKTYNFYYFYDNKNPKYSIYGGIELDSLISYQKSKIGFHELAIRNALHTSLNISKDSLNKLGSKYEIKLSNEKMALFLQEYYKLMNSDNKIPITIVPFGDVKPEKMISFNSTRSQPHQIELFNNYFWDSKLNEAILFRNFIYYEYYNEH